MFEDLSYISIVLEPHFEDIKLATATGFFIFMNAEYYLVTNWHVVTGRHNKTHEPLDKLNSGIPNKIKLWLHAPSNYESDKEEYKRWLWYCLDFPLFENEKPLWIEHPHGSVVDVVAIPIDAVFLHDNHRNYALAGISPHSLYLPPSAPVSIIGYPHGYKSFGLFPIWKTGHIASDMKFDAEEQPKFLIDATTTTGMSGSPVFSIRDKSKNIVEGNIIIAKGEPSILGVYSGRLDDSMDIGIVWKTKAISEVIQNDPNNTQSKRSYINKYGQL